MCITRQLRPDADPNLLASEMRQRPSALGGRAAYAVVREETGESRFLFQSGKGFGMKKKEYVELTLEPGRHEETGRVVRGVVTHVGRGRTFIGDLARTVGLMQLGGLGFAAGLAQLIDGKDPVTSLIAAAAGAAAVLFGATNFAHSTERSEHLLSQCAVPGVLPQRATKLTAFTDGKPRDVLGRGTSASDGIALLPAPSVTPINVAFCLPVDDRQPLGV